MLEKTKELILANMQQEKIIVTDYIENPKKDGYRGVHLIETYDSKTEKYDELNGLHIEIQLRTKLQHIWAAAVETVEYFTAQDLKADNGDGDWKDFFRLVSYEFMYEENVHTGKISGARKDIRRKIVKLATKLNVLANMIEWSGILPENRGMGDGGVDLMLLNLNTKSKELTINGYVKDDEKSFNDYESAEKENQNYSNAVLAHAKNMDEVKVAFPSYFADTREFLKHIKEIIDNVKS